VRVLRCIHVQQGVTLNEFIQLCKKYQPWYGAKVIPIESTQHFLNRCCDLGFLRRAEGNGTARYLPTHELAACMSLWPELHRKDRT
jgi:hypothetical protein